MTETATDVSISVDKGDESQQQAQLQGGTATPNMQTAAQSLMNLAHDSHGGMSNAIHISLEQQKWDHELRMKVMELRMKQMELEIELARNNGHKVEKKDVYKGPKIPRFTEGEDVGTYLRTFGKTSPCL